MSKLNLTRFEPMLKSNEWDVIVPRHELEWLRDTIRHELDLGLFNVERYLESIDRWLSPSPETSEPVKP